MKYIHSPLSKENYLRNGSFELLSDVDLHEIFLILVKPSPNNNE